MEIEEKEFNFHFFSLLLDVFISSSDHSLDEFVQSLDFAISVRQKGQHLRFYLLFILLACSFPTGFSAVNKQDPSYRQSVVMIRNIKQSNRVRTPWERNPRKSGSGSGVVIEGQMILTNAHVVSDSKYLEVKKANDAKYFPAVVKYIGHDCDLALVAPLDPSFFSDMKALPFGSLPKVNSPVQSYGFPLGLRGGHNIAVTRGIISRIEFKTYVHTGADQHLLIQTDAAINPGNSGGPAIQDGKIIGIVFQGLSSASAESVGYMIPTTVIDHFLKDIQDGTYHGFPRLGAYTFNGLQSQALREYLQVDKELTGVVINKVIEASPLFGQLQKNDILSEIDGIKIYNDGMVIVDGRRFQFNEVIDRKQINDDLKITFSRKGEKKSVSIKLKSFQLPFEYGKIYDHKFEYLMSGGLVFVNLSKNLIDTWGSSWYLSLPTSLKHLYQYQSEHPELKKHKHFILLAKILPDSVNIRSEPYRNALLDRVNGQKIYSLEALESALSSNKKSFHVFQFLGHEKPLILNAKMVKDNEATIMRKYRVPQASYLKSKP